MKLVVEGEISATSYKKIVNRLKGLSRKQLWEILDHYIFHIISDRDVNELLNILDEKALPDEEKVETTSSAIDDDLFYIIDPKERFMPTVIATVPTDDELNKFKYQLNLLYDETCFGSYIEPEIRADTAKKLIAFASANELPVLDHWTEFSEE